MNIENYPCLFSVNGDYPIRLNPAVTPVQHAPCCIQVPLRDKVKDVLEDLMQQDVVASVIEPTPWIPYGPGS